MSEEKQGNKKVNKMNLAEVNEALKKTEEHMKSLTSKYAQALLSRKEELSSK